MLKVTVFILYMCFIFISQSESKAVGGISNTKIIVPSTETVPQNHFEIEPFFVYGRTDDAVDSESLGFGSRFTLGVLNNLEAGFNLNYLGIEDSVDTDAEFDIGNIEAGLKYRLIDQNESVPFSLAYEGGVTFPTVGDDKIWFFEPAGIILTRNYTENFSSDLDLVFSLDGKGSVGLISNLGFGYFLTHQFQPVIETAYSYENPESGKNIHVIDFTAGFTAPVNDTLTIILGLTYDLYTENSGNELAVIAAFTFLF